MQTLAVKVDTTSIYAIQDAFHGTVVLVQEAQRPLMAIGTFDCRNVQHVTQILDIRIEVDTINPIGNVRRNRFQRHVTGVVLDGDALHVLQLFVDVLKRPIMVPVLAHHPLPNRCALCAPQISSSPKPGPWKSLRAQIVKDVSHLIAGWTEARRQILPLPRAVTDRGDTFEV
ncbi:hypothetical protein D3C84_455420 [compost metagenome]